MAGEYDAQAVSEASMSDSYLADAGGSMDAATAAVDSYDTSSQTPTRPPDDTSSYDTSSGTTMRARTTPGRPESFE